MPMPTDGVDLHTHTRHSDGLDTPAELVAKAARQGVRHLAVTDHDTLAALPEARAAGAARGVEVLTGIELSVQHGDFHDIHLLGYLFESEDAALHACLTRLKEGRTQRGLEILHRVNQRLNELGRAPLDGERVRQYASGVLTRPHLAQALVDQGYCRNQQEAFRDFLIPCNAPKSLLALEEGLRLIGNAGGVCSLAHPGTLSTDPNVLDPSAGHRQFPRPCRPGGLPPRPSPGHDPVLRIRRPAAPTRRHRRLRLPRSPRRSHPWPRRPWPPRAAPCLEGFATGRQRLRTGLAACRAARRVQRLCRY